MYCKSVCVGIDIFQFCQHVHVRIQNMIYDIYSNTAIVFGKQLKLFLFLVDI